MGAPSTGQYKLGFLGGGMMAEALIGGILKKSLVSPESIFVSDMSADRLAVLEKKYKVRTTQENGEIVWQSDVILIAVKPQGFPALCKQVDQFLETKACQPPGANSSPKPRYPAGKVFASIMAGVTLQTLGESIGRHGDVVRVMPNTPAMVNAAASAYALHPLHFSKDGEAKVPFVEQIFSSIGICCQLPSETYMDAVTGLSGSGPAYVYMMIEALSDGGVKNGLPRALALQLAAQTVMGSAKMVLEKGEHPAVLKNQVESPAGTTIAGTAKLEEQGFRNAIVQAVSAATQRSAELGAKK
ncbi:unnamed protein product [Amoebophrya sp. A120]|nr:unnamed protein product [Amoebophrya sp. A120]|eukprot:GSA120T00015469001.1